MLKIVVLNAILSVLNVQCKEVATYIDNADSDLGENLISSLTNDRNLDLSEDAEYEDLRAELLAYHSALASLAADNMPARRSMVNTPCWQLGGICINYKLCTGYRFLTEVPGCKDNLNVCCFTWNQFKVRDMRDKGLPAIAFPWTLHKDFGGEGVVMNDKEAKKLTKLKKNKKSKKAKALALLIRSLNK